MDLSWTEWQPLDLPDPPNAATLAEILDGGQAFRWQRLDAVSWQGLWLDRIVRLKSTGPSSIAWSTPDRIAAGAETALRHYFAAPGQIRERDALPWRSDAYLAACMEAFPGLRILRQPFGETLLTFLCSATKQIVQIKQICEELALRLGKPILPGFNALPDWDTLAHLPEEALRACRLGFRARYIKAVALALASRPGFLEGVAAAPYGQAKSALMELPGVGEKVADCVLLFGAGRMEAFPTDVWILRAMRLRYGLERWRPAQVAQFGRVHFGPYAGLAQQYLFARERASAREERKHS